MMYESILFDLDGTLTDSAPGILNALEYAFRKLGYPDHPRESLYRYVGPPLIESYMRFDGMTYDQAYTGLLTYREYFETKGIYENSVYPGVETMLQQLKAAGKRLYVATGKPEDMAETVCRHFHLTHYFAGIYGASRDEKRSAKKDVIAYALAHIDAPGRVLMVGDRANDIAGAAACGLDAAGVLWGYGSSEELRDAKFLADTPCQLAEFLV